MKTVLVLAALGLLAGAAQASLLEPTVVGACAAVMGPEKAVHACSLQYDGGRHGDASDVCREASPPLKVGPAGRTTGLAVPVDDPRDFFALPITTAMLNQRLTVVLEPAPSLRGPLATSLFRAPAPNHDLRVWGPMCVGVVAESLQPGTAPEIVSFIPLVVGVYAVQVELGPLAGLPADGDRGDSGPSAEVCHASCAGETANPAGGYALTAYAG